MLRAFVVTCAFALLTPLAFAGTDLPIEKVMIAKGEGHFPVAARLKDGRLAVVMRGGGPHLSIHGRLDIAFSSDSGKTWTQPTIVASDIGADDRNPAFGQSTDGTLVVAFFRTMRYDANGKYDNKLDGPVSMWVTRSRDGAAWSAPAQIDVSDIGWASPFGKIFNRPDGAMMMTIYGGRVKEPTAHSASGGGFSYLYRSADQGKTWQRYATISPAGFNETTVIPLPSGRLLAGLRNDGKTPSVWLSHSNDDGRTWTQPARLTPPNIYTADFLLLPDRRILLTANNRVGPFGAVGVVGDAGETSSGASRSRSPTTMPTSIAVTPAASSSKTAAC